MRISIRHELRFSSEVQLAHAVQHVLLTPVETASQKILEWSIAMPGMDGAAVFTDAFGNTAHLVSQTRPEDDLFIGVSGIVETTDTHGVVGRLATDPLVSIFKRTTAQTRPNGNLVNRMRAQAKAGMGRVDLLHWLMGRLYEAMDAAPAEGEEPAEIIAEDHAHVFVAAARGVDIPARFVRGYVFEQGTDANRMHAWAEAWDDKLGWIGFDPSANLCPTDAYVRVACGLDAETTQPVRLVPDLAREGADMVRVTQAVMGQQQQQQSGAQNQ